MSNTITEAELTDFFINKVVKRLTIVQTKESTYKIVVNLTWKEGDYTLVTTRKTPREWVSLDRLIKHMREKYKSHKLIRITLILLNETKK
ncbi:conserved hypothetical protein [Candidatus Methylobacter favarea]|uniref:Uncharacterized protein n=1 Tax=Candidatus Methylobacter favarea TaxID=2707345 RepID=A0A8S0WP74_9GAMM|nr:hypothetical protein [Candidatus Methylobacter favarea]CAA9890775.1 conserved hypothetical protein [Candidatus Methylobacter favarea]